MLRSQPPWSGSGKCRSGFEPLDGCRIPLYRWIAFVLVDPLIFGLAALGTRALTRVA